MNRSVQAVLLVALLTTACASDGPTQQARSTPRVTASPRPTAEPTPTSPPDPFVLARSYDSASPAELARVLRARDRSAAAAKRHQAAYRQLVRMPQWRDRKSVV
jgi:hypothetical protein